VWLKTALVNQTGVITTGSISSDERALALAKGLAVALRLWHSRQPLLPPGRIA
jgi:hypothetical protein